MSRQWAINASPLILLAKIERLDLLSELADDLLVPEVVLREIGAKPEGLSVLARIDTLSGLRVESGVVVSMRPCAERTPGSPPLRPARRGATELGSEKPP
jgi:hypothetical protein